MDRYYENKDRKTQRLTMRLTDAEAKTLSDIINRKLIIKDSNGEPLNFWKTTQIVQFLIDSVSSDNLSDAVDAYDKKQQETKLDKQSQIELLATRKYYTYQLRRIGTNINQIAKKANSTNTVALQDLEDIKNLMTAIKQEIKDKKVFDDD